MGKVEMAFYLILGGFAFLIFLGVTVRVIVNSALRAKADFNEQNKKEN